MQLTDVIIQKIKEEGPVPFHDFMDMCLYYPDLGYYTSPEDKIGPSGDYYTSANLSPVFGALIGKQIEKMWSILDEQPFTIVEYGAGTGLLCHDILDYLKDKETLYNQLNYCIIEKSPVMREKMKKHLREKVSWYDSIDEIGEITGCILSNELVDNFPVHQVVMEDELMEVFVDHANGFVELLRPAREELSDYLAELDVQFPKGFRAEINLKAIEWIKEIASALKQGFVITIDYGYVSSELYRENRSSGTLMCYHKHSLNDYLYENIGEQDITSHVNFSALQHWGLKYGLDYCGLTSQAQFLLALGLIESLNKTMEQGEPSWLDYKKHAFLKHTLLVDMGSKFKVLIQRKGVPDHEVLGLKFSNISIS